MDKKKKLTVMIEGNATQVEEAIHDLRKAVSQQNRRPECVLTVNVDDPLDTDVSSGFETGDGQ